MNRNFKLTARIGRSATIALPSSKSISNRLLVMDALEGGHGHIGNLARCNDTEAMVVALTTSARREVSENSTRYVNAHLAGTASRFLTAYFAGLEGSRVVLDGEPRLRQRPISELVEALRQCGAEISYATPPEGGSNKSGLPLFIEGRKLKGGVVEMDGSVSSQFISAMMMVAPYMEQGLELRLNGNVVSKPYINMTASLMSRFGVKADVEFSGRQSRIVIPGGAYIPIETTVESDWSAASYWYEIAALAPSLQLELKGLQPGSLQGDSRVAAYFRAFGVETEFSPGGVLLSRRNCSRREMLSLDLSGQPDLAQTLVVTACLKGTPFSISGLETLLVKETDRIAALTQEMRKLGYPLTYDGNGVLEWDGSRVEAVPNPAIATYGDHRMAMAFAPAALLFPGLVIEHPEVVGKSYPDYWKHLADAGFKIEAVE